MRFQLIEELRFRAKRMLMPALLFFVLFYAFYHMISGERGLMVWLRLSDQVDDLKQQNAAFDERLGLMNDKVLRLQSETLDPDFVDEQIRKSLPVAHPNERVIYY